MGDSKKYMYMEFHYGTEPAIIDSICRFFNIDEEEIMIDPDFGYSWETGVFVVTMLEDKARKYIEHSREDNVDLISPGGFGMADKIAEPEEVQKVEAEELYALSISANGDQQKIQEINELNYHEFCPEIIEAFKAFIQMRKTTKIQVLSGQFTERNNYAGVIYNIDFDFAIRSADPTEFEDLPFL